MLLESEIGTGFLNIKLRRKFFIQKALVKILKYKVGKMEGGYVVPKRGMEKEFARIINKTLFNVGFSEEEVNEGSWNKYKKGK